MSEHDEALARTPWSLDASREPESRWITYYEALQARRAELLAIPMDDVTHGASFSADSAEEIAQGTVLKLQFHRASFVAEFGEAGEELVNRVFVTARATLQTDIDLRLARRPIDFAALQAGISKHYRFLHIEGQSLVNRGLLDARELEPAASIQGYRALLDSTLVLVSVFREFLPAFAQKTPVTDVDLDAAERAVMEMRIALAIREHGAPRIAAADLRDRALTMLVREYAELQRKVHYLRWHHGDADEIAPSFWATRKKRRRRSREETSDETSRESPDVAAGVVSAGARDPENGDPETES